LRLRRLTLAILVALVAIPAASASSGIRGEKQRQHAVRAQVAKINEHLDSVVQRWDGQRLRLTSLQATLRENKHVLAIARSNLRVAQTQLEQRLYEDYVHPAPGSLDILIGASNISDLIDKVEATHAVASQDLEIAAKHNISRTPLQDASWRCGESVAASRGQSRNSARNTRPSPTHLRASSGCSSRSTRQSKRSQSKPPRARKRAP
jgi:hypothetical protein